MENPKKEGLMKKYLALVSALLFFLCCAPKGEKVEKVMEDGVEVVLNRLEPYSIKGESATFTLEEEFSIDTEDEKIAELGLTDIGGYFDADSSGNVYLVNPKGDESIIYKFDKDGDFVSSFSRRGQGPGELLARGFPSLHLTIDHRDNIAVSDFRNHKVSFFEKDGSLINEVKIGTNLFDAVPLANGNYLGLVSVLDASSEYINQNPLILFNKEFEKIKELDKQLIPNPIVGKKLKATWHILCWSVTKEKVYTGFQERGYEIYVYDFDGNLLQKIKKDYKPVPVPDEYKEKFLKTFESPLFDSIRNKIYFPDSMPPFHAFFSDDEGRLFVMTYEKGPNPGEYIYDIFDPEGVFIGRKSLKVFHNESDMYAKMKNGRFYCLNEKDSGYKELKVYKVNWK